MKKWRTGILSDKLKKRVFQKDLFEEEELFEKKDFFQRNKRRITVGLRLCILAGVLVSGRAALRSGVLTSSGTAEKTEQNQVFAELSNLSCVLAAIEDYSEAVQTLPVNAQGEQILAGFGGLNREMLHRKALTQGTEAAASLGAYAMQILQGN